MFNEVVCSALQEIRVCRYSVVPSREDEEIEVLIRADQGIYEADGLGRSNVVVHSAVHNEELAFEILRQSGVVSLDINVFVIESIVGLCPQGIVHALVVVACGGHPYFIYTGILKHSP